MKSLILPFAMLLANEEGVLHSLLSPITGLPVWLPAVGFILCCYWLASSVMELRGRHHLR